MFIGSFGEWDQYGLYIDKEDYVIKEAGLDLSINLCVRVDLRELIRLQNLIEDAIQKTVNDSNFKAGG